jgi:hypothetical protein
LLTRWLARRSGGAGAIPEEPGSPTQAQRIVVLEEGRTATGDYLLMPWLAAFDRPVRRLDARDPPSAGRLLPGDFVVVVRYLHPAWRQALQRQRANLAGVAYFMDDDLLDPAALAELAPSYAKKIRSLALSQRSWFESIGTQWWVATTALATKYAVLAPTLIPLTPPAALLTGRTGVKIAYHGTASHGRELAWLRELLPAVLEACADAHVEVFGDHAVNRLYRDLPRVHVVHPMRWEAYLDYTTRVPADIGLAPLLPGRFNVGRGPVKFFDHVRLGAAGVYSDAVPYAGFVRAGVDGLLLPNDPACWVETLIRLVRNPAECRALALQASERVQPKLPSGAG